MSWMSNRDLIGRVHRRSGYCTLVDTQRALRRVQRWLRSPRGGERPPAHIAEKMRLFRSLQ